MLRSYDKIRVMRRRSKKEYMDIYTDYLISVQGQASATRLSKIIEELSHDQITRFLSNDEFDSKTLWFNVKKIVREIEDEEGVIVFDDTIIQKSWSKENEIICWHYDHSKGRYVKGVNLMSCLYINSESVSIPVNFEIIRKDIKYCEIETRKEKRKSLKTKNEIVREMFIKSIQNHIKFKYVLMDSWFSSKETLELITKKRSILSVQ